MHRLKIIYILLNFYFLNILSAGNLIEFDIHFAVITKNAKAGKINLEQLKNEVEILNKYFVDEKRNPVVKFKFKSAGFYDDIKNSGCAFVRLGDSTDDYDSDKWADIFNQCSDIKIKDPKTINFYIFDSYSKQEGFKDVTSHGKRNSNRPYVLIDIDRIGHNIQSPEEHEMGHAFGLDHVFIKGARLNDHTNIMASSDGYSSGGLRDIGFNEEQVETILFYAAKIKEKLK